MQLEWLAVGGIGAAIGFAGGVFGLGGGILAIPALVMIFGLDQQLAQGTTFLMVAPNAVLGIWHYYRHGSVDRRYAVMLAACGLVGGYCGTLFALTLDAQHLRRFFSLFMLALIVYLACREVLPSPARRPAADWRWCSLVGLFCGSLTGFVTVGGAITSPPLLTRFFGLSQQQAQGLALAIVAPSALISLVTYAVHREVDWNLGLPLCFGAMLTMRAGVGIAHRLPEQTLRRLFYVLLLAVALMMFLR